MGRSVVSREDGLDFAMSSKEARTVEQMPADKNSISERTITSTYNAEVGFSGFNPAVAATYSHVNADKDGNAVSFASSVKVTLGEGIDGGISAVKRWTHKMDDGNRLDVSAAAGADVSTRHGLNGTVGVRADYVRKEDGLSPYFTAIASTREDQSLNVGVGVCKDVKIMDFAKSTLCGGVETRENRQGVSFGIGRNF